jgi:guanylate kinase
MDAAVEELSHYEEFDYLIVNDDFETALAELVQVVEGNGEQFQTERRLGALESLIADLLPQKVP